MQERLLSELSPVDREQYPPGLWDREGLLEA